VQHRDRAWQRDGKKARGEALSAFDGSMIHAVRVDPAGASSSPCSRPSPRPGRWHLATAFAAVASTRLLAVVLPAVAVVLAAVALVSDRRQLLAVVVQAAVAAVKAELMAERQRAPRIHAGGARLRDLGPVKQRRAGAVPAR
jgi:hypothetical protein